MPSARLTARGRDDSGHMVEMKFLQFRALAALVPIAPAAQALYVCVTLHLPPLVRAFKRFATAWGNKPSRPKRLADIK